jgi:hypothetical protein
MILLMRLAPGSARYRAIDTDPLRETIEKGKPWRQLLDRRPFQAMKAVKTD